MGRRAGTLHDAFEARDNGVGFLRLALAFAVLVSHSFVIGAFGREPLVGFGRNAFTLGAVAVVGFFLLSGMLLTRSWMRRPQPVTFAVNRVLRILPAYWVCLLVCAFVIAPICWMTRHHGSIENFPFVLQSPANPAYTRNYAGEGSAVGFVINNFTLQYKQWSITGTLPHVPENLFGQGILNYSLWTLFWEALCYVGLLVLGVMGLISVRFRAAIAVLTAGALLMLAYVWQSGWGLALPGAIDITVFQVLWITSFFVGVTIALFADRIPMSSAVAAASFVVFVAMLHQGWLADGAILPLAYVVAFAAMRAPVRNLERRIDLSYGVYLYAFPLQQLATLVHWNRFNVWAYTALATALVVPVAAVSWYVVERPALRRKPATSLERSAPPAVARAAATDPADARARSSEPRPRFSGASAVEQLATVSRDASV